MNLIQGYKQSSISDLTCSLSSCILKEKLMRNAVEIESSLADEQIIGHCLKMVMENLPPGVKFLPSDTEMFELLKTKNRDPGDITVLFIKEIDLLKHEPWELRWLSPLQREGEDWYFFYAPERYEKGGCSNKKRKKNGESCKPECFKRSTKSGSGYWEQTGNAKPIDGFGVRRTLRFYLNNPGSKKKKGDWTDYKIYQYEPTDFDFIKNPFVVLRLERNPGDKCTSKCEAGSSELLASNAVNSPSENTLPQLSNASEGESLNGMLTDRSGPDEGVPSQDITRSSSPIGGQADLYQSTSEFGSYKSLTEMVLDRHPEFSALLSSHFSDTVVQESSKVNHTLISDQVYPSQHSTSDFGTEVPDDRLQVDCRPLVGSEKQAGGGALPPQIDQDHGASTFKRFKIDNLSNIQFGIGQEDWFTKISSCNSTGGVDVRCSGDTNTNAAYQRVTEYSQSNPENISPATL